MLPAVTVFILMSTILLQGVPFANAQLPNPGDYIVPENLGDVLSRIEPSGARTPVFSFAAGTRPAGAAVDPAGNYIVTESQTHIISRISLTGARTVVYDYTASGMPIAGPLGVAIGTAGNYIVAEYVPNAISRISPGGVRTAVYDYVASGFLGGPAGIAVDSGGNYVVAESVGHVISKISVAGTRNVVYDYAPTSARPFGIAIDSAGNYIVAESGAKKLSRIVPGSPTTRDTIFDYTLTGTAGEPVGVAIDPAGNYVVTECCGANRVSKITPGGVHSPLFDYTASGLAGNPNFLAIWPTPPSPDVGDYIVTQFGLGAISRITLAGGGTPIFIFSPADSAPTGVAIDSASNYIVAEANAHAISKIAPAGTRTVVYDYAVSGPPGTGPTGVAIDIMGNYVVAEFTANMISKITPTGVRTVVYDYAASGPAGAGPFAVAIDSAGNYIVAESTANVISKITPAGGRSLILNLAAGAQPVGVAVDSAGNYIVAEWGATVLSKITPAGARTAIYDYAASGPAGAAPNGLAIDSAGNYVVAETGVGVGMNPVISGITPAGVRVPIFGFPPGAAPAGVAIIKTRYDLIIQVSPSGGGSTNPSPGTYSRESGSSVTVSETPAGGFAFDHWDLDGANVGSDPSYTATVDAVHTLTAVFHSVAVPDFQIASDPSSISVSQGGTGSSTIKLQSVNSFSSAVELSSSWVGAAPTDVTTDLPTPVTPPADGLATSPLTITAASSASTGDYVLRVTGTSGALIHSVDVPIAVSAGAADFTIGAAPSSLSLSPGTSGSSTITVQSVGTFSSPVTLTTPGAPAGLALSLGTNPVTPPAGSAATSALTVTISGAGVGTYTVTVTGTSGTLTHSTSVTVQVTAAPTGCLIATATFGSELSDEVQFLRGFRDRSILETSTGSGFMIAFNAWYYSFSPAVAQFIREHSTMQTAVKLMLYPLIGILRIGATAFDLFPTNPEASAVISGLVVSSLIGIVYLASPLVAVLGYSSRARRLAARLQLPTLGVLISALALVALTVAVGGPLPMMMLATSAIVLASLTLSALFMSRLIVRVVKPV